MHEEDRAIIITGGSSGLGLGIARYMSEQGWTVINLDAQRTQSDSYRPDIELIIDVSSPEEVESVFQKVFSEHAATSLVCMAGVVFDQPLVGIKNKTLKAFDFQDWQRTIDVNLTGTFLCIRAFASHLVKARMKGTAITCSSPAASGAAGQTAYSASKAGVEALTIAAAKELMPWGIRVCGIRPPLTKTPMAQQYPERIMDNLKKSSLIGRYAEPEETAQSIAFLLSSPLSSGRIYSFDGGIDL